MSTTIFLENPGILVDKNYIFDFIPNINATVEERINAIVRFSLYFSLILMITKNNYRYCYIFIATLFITYLFYDNNKEHFISKIESNSNNNLNTDSGDANLYADTEINTLCKNDSSDENNSVNMDKDCDEPRCNNLFMNVLPTDDFKTKKKACSFTKEISDKVNDGFYSKFKKDENTFFNQDFGMRQFYSMPNTQVPNDQGTFAKWLYNTPVSCSTGDNMLLKQDRACSIDAANLHDLEQHNASEFICLSDGPAYN